jgi:hypothetical protein
MQRAQPIETTVARDADQSASLAVGYSVLRTGAGDALRACIVIPHVHVPRALALDQGAMRLLVDVGVSSDLLLVSLPDDIVRLIARHPDRVLLLSVDTLSRARVAVPCVFGQPLSHRSTPQETEATARSAFNGFLNHAVAAGGVQAENSRVRTRQPQTESFVRRSLAVVKNLAPGAAVGVTTRSIKASACGSSISGPLAVAELTAQLVRTLPGLAALLEPSSPAPAGASADPGLGELDIFALLHNCAQLAVHRHFGSNLGFTHTPVSVVCEATGLVESLPASVAKAADSVFAQSFADAHAVAVYAARRGKDAALALAANVRAKRSAAGDYDTYSLAPLSHDTKSALSTMTTTLHLCGDTMASMDADELFEQARFAGIEGLAAWMQRHGADYDAATRVIQSLQRISPILAFPGPASDQEGGEPPSDSHLS